MYILTTSEVHTAIVSAKQKINKKHQGSEEYDE